MPKKCHVLFVWHSYILPSFFRVFFLSLPDDDDDDYDELTFTVLGKALVGYVRRSFEASSLTCKIGCFVRFSLNLPIFDFLVFPIVVLMLECNITKLCIYYEMIKLKSKKSRKMSVLRRKNCVGLTTDLSLN